MNVIDILAPRYHDRTVLVAKYKVKSGYNYIKFSNAPAYKGLYRFHYTDIDTNNVCSNGKILCYVIPLDKLELVEEEKEDKPTTEHKITVEIDGKVREFNNAKDVIVALAMFLAREEGNNGR